MSGWKLNKLDFEDVQEGIKLVQDTINKIENLPHNREIIDTILEESFFFDTSFVVENIRKVCFYFIYKTILLGNTFDFI